MLDSRHEHRAPVRLRSITKENSPTMTWTTAILNAYYRAVVPLIDYLSDVIHPESPILWMDGRFRPVRDYILETTTTGDGKTCSSLLSSVVATRGEPEARPVSRILASKGMESMVEVPQSCSSRLRRRKDDRQMTGNRESTGKIVCDRRWQAIQHANNGLQTCESPSRTWPPSTSSVH